MLKKLILGVCTAALAATAIPAFPQASWPQKPVRFILSLPPGSGVDGAARILGEAMSQNWGQVAVVDNHPGGQNIIGAVAAARAPADGYNFYFSTAAALVSNRYLFSSLPYDPSKDFMPVGMIGKAPFAICVQPGSPIKNLGDLFRQAKATPGKLSMANEGPKTFGGLTARLLNSEARVDINLVSYVSVGTAMQDTIGGHTDAVINDVASSAQLVKQGLLRPIAVTSSKRVEDWPQVPTIAETIPGFDMVGWVVVVAPKGTPANIIERFNHDLDAALGRKDIAEKIKLMGLIVDGAGTPDTTAAFIKEEDARWQSLSREIGLLPE